MADLDLQIITNIEGLDELERDFINGGPRAVKKFLTRVEKRAAKLLQTALSENAPYLTGDLSEDIHIQVVQAPGALVCRIGPSQDTFYGLMQEFGTVTGTPALHWMELTAKENQDAVLQEYMDAVTESLQDIKQS